MTVLAEEKITVDAGQNVRTDAVPDRTADFADFMELVDQNPDCALYGYIYQNRFHLTGIGKPNTLDGPQPNVQFEFTLNACRCSSCGRPIENATLCRRCLIYI